MRTEVDVYLASSGPSGSQAYPGSIWPETSECVRECGEGWSISTACVGIGGWVTGLQ